MGIELPKPLAAYFAAKNRKDIDGMLSAFAADAIVHDEGEDHHGRAAIRSWMEETTRKYAVTADVTELAKDGEKLRVAALVSGTFPGSPATLHYNFTLEGDAVKRLEIG
ncbi:nuclear transport factor 2 family protein [Rhizobium sp. BK251]|uniref:nuclear transport factor 2 family protein n=1 Tax=Rhizobium sp. BK251 TaxID=2512125 RepID=UPI0010528D6C|nr:nuclear transport factor 2 family protein [Rhizobium sp. BK251]TCL69735.1 SnoaL-like protein [Rhizobium sp. BK251]